MRQMTLDGGPFAAIAAMLLSFEQLPAAICFDNHYVTGDTMLARGVHGTCPAKAFMVMTTNEACTRCQYDRLHLLRARFVSSLRGFIGWLASGLDIFVA